MCTVFLHSSNAGGSSGGVGGVGGGGGGGGLPLVVCENPTYFLAGKIFEDHGVSICMDAYNSS
jgi:hypothetical protein